MPAADLQRALLKLPDDLVAQALCAARDDVRARVLANLSRRRKSDVMRKAAALEGSGEISERSARAALHNLVRNVFEVSSPAADAAEASTLAANVKRRKRGAEEPDEDSDRSEAPDLTEAAFDALREARGVVSAFEGVSAYSGHLRRCRQGMSGAVLLRSWLGRKGGPSRESILENICGLRKPQASG
jgi:hypothetical protein